MIAGNELPRGAREIAAWWREAVIYQVYTRSFYDSNGDGVGDLEGVIQKLDYLTELGVDVLWLSPLHPTPNIDYGYDGTDYYGIAPEMGTLLTFDRLVAEAARRGIRIMMDLVMDYTSTAHPWFVQARSSRASPFHDWYIWADGLPDQAPNNWPAFFSAGSAWTFDASSRRWYLHYFTEEQPELNWANPVVRHQIHDAMRFWLDRGIAGFRLDVISFLSKPETLADMPPAALSAAGRFFANGPRLHEYLLEMRREVFDRYPGCVALGEGFGLTSDQVLDFVAPERGELDLMFLFDISALTFAETGDRQRPTVVDIKAIFKRWDEMLVPAGAWPVLFLGNHDVARMVSRFGDERPQHRVASAKLLATVLLTLRGTPVIYQGDEIGMANPQFGGIEEFRDVAVLNAWRAAKRDGHSTDALIARMNRVGRDTGRTPVHWDGSKNAGFSAGEPWIKVADDAADTNVACQDGDPGSVLNHYRALTALRRARRVLRQGDLVIHDIEHEQVFAFERRGGEDRVMVVLNWSDADAVYEPPSAGGFDSNPLVASHGPPQWEQNALALRAYETLIFEQRR
jgi:oligo-1,6-glucosidase